MSRRESVGGAYPLGRIVALVAKSLGVVAFACIVATPGLPCSLREPLAARDVFTAPAFHWMSSATHQDPVETVGNRPVFFAAYAQLQRLMPNGFENVDVALAPEVFTGLTQTIYRPVSPLPDGDYRSGTNPVVRVSGGATIPLPVIPHGVELSVTVVEHQDGLRSSCGAEPLKCGPQDPFLVVDVIVPGLDETGFLGNYVLYLQDDVGLNEAQLLGATIVRDGAVQVETLLSLSPTAKELCVEIAGFGWDGGIGEAVSLGCSGLQRP